MLVFWLWIVLPIGTDLSGSSTEVVMNLEISGSWHIELSMISGLTGCISQLFVTDFSLSAA